MRQLISAEGAAGGHGTMAGGRLFRPVATDVDKQATFEQMVKRLLDLIGRGSPPSAPLIGS
jgi:hypothetical protein